MDVFDLPMVNSTLVEMWSLRYGLRILEIEVKSVLKNENAKQLAPETNVEAVVKIIHELYTKRGIPNDHKYAQPVYACREIIDKYGIVLRFNPKINIMIADRLVKLGYKKDPSPPKMLMEPPEDEELQALLAEVETYIKTKAPNLYKGSNPGCNWNVNSKEEILR